MSIYDVKLIACCGLYCASCKSYIKGKCGGCMKNEKAGWCGVRKCCIIKNIENCGECNDFKDLNDCKKLNNIISKTIGFFLNSSRVKSVQKIKEIGNKAYAEFMSSNNLQSVKK